MAFELIRVVADGVVYEGWESISINWQRNSGVIQFVLTATEIGKPGEITAFDKWHFPPGTNIDILAGNDVIVSGQVLVYAPSADADQHSITLSGNTMGWTYLRSSIDPHSFKDGRFDRITDVDLATRFAAAACTTMENYTQPDELPWFHVKQGATYYQEAMRILQQRGKTLMAMPTGGLAIVDNTSWQMNAQASLIQGLNILRMSAKLDGSSSEEIIVRGQNPIGTNQQEHLQPEATVNNPFGAPCVFKIIVDQSVTTQTLAMRRAIWERIRSHGATMIAQIVTPGWRHQGGGFWAVNEGVYVNAPWLQIDCTMAIDKVQYIQNSAVGTITDITLINPFVAQMHPSSPAQQWPCNSGPMWHYLDRDDRPPKEKDRPPLGR